MSTKGDVDFIQRRTELVNAANQIFDKMRKLAEDLGPRGALISVREIAQQAGLEVSDNTLVEMGVAPLAQPMPFVSWTTWFPVLPLWSHYWKINLPSSPAARLYAPLLQETTADINRLIASVPVP